jgi:ketosteroid isomerase-like protein
MNIWKASTSAVLLMVGFASTGRSQGIDLQGAGAQIVKADTEFARSVADRNRERFLSLIAETATFNGGSPNELRGRDAIMKGWEDFFTADGPTLTWAPSKGEVIGAGDVGYTIGRSVLRAKDKDGKPTERIGQYVTVWKKQADGSWKVVFDTGSTFPSGR